MRLFRSARWILMTLLLCLVPASSYAGVFISVGFAPPVLPVYVQPVCPEPGLMWTPGYWALWSRRLLLGSWSLGACALYRGAVDAGLLGLGEADCMSGILDIGVRTLVTTAA